MEAWAKLLIHRRSDTLLTDIEKALADQNTTLHNLRVRTSYILTLNGVALSFFANEFFYSGQTQPEEVGASDNLLIAAIAIIMSIAAIALCLKILIPSGGWVFSHSTKKFLSEFVFVEGDADEIEAKTQIALMREGHRDINKNKLEALQSWFLFAALLVFGQILFWILGEVL